MATDPSLDPLEPTVSTDLLDYAPGDTAVITAEGFIVGSTIEFQVLHWDAGADGIYGTEDDIIGGDGYGDGHESWTITDGVRTAGADGILGTDDDGGDLDGVADGKITTSWYVNPDDSLNETFLLTATGSGTDGLIGTDDDQFATTSFTDAIQVKYNQWSNFTSPEWQNGALNANQNRYFEGEVKPHVVEASGVVEGTRGTRRTQRL